MTGLLEYELGGGVRAFTAGRDVDLPCAVVQPHQTHSVNVVCVDRPDLTCEDLEGVDALVTDLPDVAIGVRTADCIPVLLYDPVHRAIGTQRMAGNSEYDKQEDGNGDVPPFRDTPREYNRSHRSRHRL